MTSLQPFAAVRPGEHACCRLARSADRGLVARAVVRTALARDHKAVYLSDRDRSAVLRELDGDLTLDEPIRRAIAHDQLDIRGATDTYMPDGVFEGDRMVSAIRGEHALAMREGYAALSITAEMTWALRGAPGTEDLAEYERVADAVQEPTLVLLCQYEQGRFAAGTLTDVAAAHQVDVSPELAPIARTRCLSAARTNAGSTLRLAGELDHSAAPAVSHVLDAHFHGDVRVDLADVSYADVTGLRALRGRTERRLTIAAASDVVRRLMGLMCWDSDDLVDVPKAT
jgi:anti-anti-sigma factor